MPVEDAACRGCSAIPEMHFGSWVPHPPGAPCLDALAIRARSSAPSCIGGLHVFPDAGGKCACGQDFLSFALPPKPSPSPWYLER